MTLRQELQMLVGNATYPWAYGICALRRVNTE